MKNIFTLLFALLTGSLLVNAQTGLGTSTPDANAMLDITSTTKGLLLPRLTATQQATLAATLTAAQTGMLITDATTGKPFAWSGTAWKDAAGLSVTAKTPLVISSANNIALNPGTAAGDLITWDGNNWVNKQPAVQHFTKQVDNHQPYLVSNYVIAEFGIFPSQNDASEPYVGEIYLMGCNFAPTGFAFCNGALLAISVNPTLFNLIGTTYGGDGQNTFALPNLQSRVAIHQGNNGTSTYFIGQTAGTETKTFSH